MYLPDLLSGLCPWTPLGDFCPLTWPLILGPGSAYVSMKLELKCINILAVCTIREIS